MSCPPRILFDYQVFSEQCHGGVSRYFFELLRRLPALGTAPYLPLKLFNNTYLRGTTEGRGALYCGGVSFRGKNRLMSMLNRRTSRAALRAGGFDVFHPTYFDPYFLDNLCGKPFVLTIYDMIHELFPKNFSAPREIKMSEWKRILASKAAKIITISDKTREDVVRLLGVNPKKVQTIHLANSIDPAAAVWPEGLNVKPGYLLFVGGRAGYKNFTFMARALAPLLEKEGIPLVCAGGGKFTTEEEALLSGIGLKNVVQCEAGDSQLAWLYSNALALVFPSLYEGFGIPVLEAFACGCPVALSSTGSLPEVGGEAAVYFDPTSAGGISDCVSGLLYDSALRESLRTKGRSRLNDFSWDRTAEKTLSVYNSCRG